MKRITIEEVESKVDKIANSAVMVGAHASDLNLYNRAMVDIINERLEALEEEFRKVRTPSMGRYPDGLR